MIILLLICSVIEILCIVYFVFNPNRLGELLRWYWDKSKVAFVWLWNWLKGISK